MNLFVVGEHTSKVGKDEAAWSLLGVFDTEEKAVNACRKRNHFVGKVGLNERLPDERMDWPGIYYPKDTDA
jgi:hypothetical protein